MDRRRRSDRHGARSGRGGPGRLPRLRGRRGVALRARRRGAAGDDRRAPRRRPRAVGAGRRRAQAGQGRQEEKAGAPAADSDALVGPWIDRAVELDVQEARFARAATRAVAGDRPGALADLVAYVAREPNPEHLAEARALRAGLGEKADPSERNGRNDDAHLSPRLLARIRLIEDRPDAALRALGGTCTRELPTDRLVAIGMVYEYADQRTAARGCYEMAGATGDRVALTRLARLDARLSDGELRLADRRLLEQAARLDVAAAWWALARLELSAGAAGDAGAARTHAALALGLAAQEPVGGRQLDSRGRGRRARALPVLARRRRDPARAAAACRARRLGAGAVGGRAAGPAPLGRPDRRGGAAKTPRSLPRGGGRGRRAAPRRAQAPGRGDRRRARSAGPVRGDRPRADGAAPDVRRRRRDLRSPGARGARRGRTVAAARARAGLRRADPRAGPRRAAGHALAARRPRRARRDRPPPARPARRRARRSAEDEPAHAPRRRGALTLDRRRRGRAAADAGTGGPPPDSRWPISISTFPSRSTRCRPSSATSCATPRRPSTARPRRASSSAPIASAT